MRVFEVLQFGQQLGERDQKSRRAKAALQRAVFEEGGLGRMRCVRLTESLDGGHRVSIHLNRE